jgi:cytochrome c oxidase subunit 2
MARLSHLRNPALVAVLGIAVLAVFAACSSPQTTFEPRSDAADKILTLYILIIVVSGAIGAAVLIGMGYLLIRYRERPGVKARQIHGNNTLEVAWTIAPILVLLVVGIPAIFGIVGMTREPVPDALHVRVIAHQWWWEVRYPGLGPNGDDLVTANEIHVPIGREINITIESKDVIHSFWVPHLIGKLDAVPNHVNRLEPFTASDTGVYYGQCAEFCGLAHALMRFRVSVDTLGDFDGWVAAQNTPAPPLEDGTYLASGQGIFIANCSVCHTVNGTAAAGTFGPNLTGFGSRLTLGAGVWDNTQDNVEAWIRNASEMKPLPPGLPDDYAYLGSGNPTMPRFDESLSPEEIQAVSAYIRSLTLN